MKNQQTDTVDPEFIDASETDDAETQIRSIAVPANLNEIAASGQAECIIASRVQIVKTLRKESIRMTRPEDWVLFKDPNTGREIGYLQDTGCQRIAPLWGIETTPISQSRIPEISSNPDDEFAWETMVDGYCNVTQRNFKGVVGTRYSTEKYAEQSAAGIRREVAVRKASRANADGTVTRKASGLNAVPIGDLMDAWDDPKRDKMIPRCALGRGYGSQAERQGGQMQQSSEVKAGEEPFCDQCNPPKKMKFVKGGVSSRTGNPYGAFWSCTANKDHKTVDHGEYMKKVEGRRAAGGDDHREPGAEG